MQNRRNVSLTIFIGRDNDRLRVNPWEFRRSFDLQTVVGVFSKISYHKREICNRHCNVMSCVIVGVKLVICDVKIPEHSGNLAWWKRVPA